MTKVTCIMPCNRPEDLPAALVVFAAQTYADKQLVVVLNGLDVIAWDAQLPQPPDVLYVHVPGKQTIGYLRNVANQYAHGAIIIHFDSDDWYAPDYIARCVERLSICNTTGLRRAYFTDGRNAWRYTYGGGQPYVIGSGMAYWKYIWDRNRFKHLNTGEDLAFCARAGHIIPLEYIDGFVARIHSKNTASHLAVKNMLRVPLTDLPIT